MIDRVRGLTRGHMVRARSDTADTRHYPGHFFNRSALAELLEAAQLGYLKVGIAHTPIVVQENLYLTVSLQPGNGVNTYLVHFASSLASMRFRFSIELAIPNR